MAPQKTLPLSALGLRAKGGQDVEITGLSVDSRTVKPGHLFAALPGSKLHGGEFIQYALRMEAAAILTDREGARIAADELAASKAALIVTEDPRAALAYAAALWFGAQPEVMVAVTGTNGGPPRFPTEMAARLTPYLVADPPPYVVAARGAGT